MNLDDLYSGLTLKTNAKLVLVVLDGVGDLATKEQDYMTPLEAATTPNLDVLTQDAAQGLAQRFERDKRLCVDDCDNASGLHHIHIGMIALRGVPPLGDIIGRC